MKILAVDCSTSLGSATLFLNSDKIYHRTWDKKNSHASLITIEIEKLFMDANCSLANIDKFALNIGPGSFTGIRVGLNTIKSFSYSTNKPIYCCNSIDLLSVVTKVSCERTPLICAINAQRGDVFYKIYKYTEEAWFSESASVLTAKPRQLEQMLPDKFYFAGNCLNLFATNSFKNRIINLDTYISYPCSKELAILCSKNHPLGQTMDWKSTTPLYIRPSAAEENLKNSI